MSNEMKRLMKCDLLYYSFKSFKSVALAAIVLLLWFSILIGTGEISNMLFLFITFMGVLFITMSMSDWQFRNGLYICMGMKRENVYRIILIRGICWVVLSILIETIIGVVFYPQDFHIELLILSICYFLICQGLGHFSSVLAYQKKKIGTCLQVTSLIVTGMVAGFCGVMTIENEFEYINLITDWIYNLNIIVLAVVAGLVWGIGMYQAYKQLKEFAVS